MKKFDLEFTVDPLFKKTCADFDEGGASGLLLNHLSVYRGGKIVFDASDVDATAHIVSTEQETRLLSEEVDISKLVGIQCLLLMAATHW